jgi:acetate kinase
MKVLCINAGSSTVKFQLFEMPEEKSILSSNFEKIGEPNSFYSFKINGEKIRKEAVLNNHEDAVRIFLQELIDLKIIDSLEEIKGIGHRVVQGADRYNKGALITDEVIKDIEELIPLAPLHNKAHLLGINVAMKLLPHAKNVAVFDTAFHQTMPEEQYIYPVPYEWYTDYGVRRYGFHGTSHKYLTQTISEILGRNDLKIITCHLGSGSSISAIKDGKVVATSMGLTPLGGIAMGTRCGDIDPSIIPYVIKQSGKTLDEVMNDLNKRSGFLGISGISPDSRDIEDGIARGDERCILAQTLFTNRIVSFIASYYVLLDKPDVIVFSAGIGENSPYAREKIVEKLSSLNIFLDKEANNVRGKIQKISSDESEVLCYAIPTNEELMIVRETYELIERL